MSDPQSPAGRPASRTWSPELYLRFEEQRSRPARDLLAQVGQRAPAHVVDLGCGPGNSTQLLAERWPTARIVGTDTSAKMLAAARLRLPEATFELGDIAGWTPPEQTDVVFANAVFQWVPDHLAHLARILGALRPGATLAIQVPDNLDEPSHRLMRTVAELPAFAADLSFVKRAPIHPVRTYFEALQPLARTVDVWHTAYNHVLDGAGAIVEWVRGTGLGPYLEPLDPARRELFLAEYRARIADAYPAMRDGRVILRFPRLFIVATK